MYLKYHKAGLTPTTSVTSTAISSVKMAIGHKSLTNLRSEMIFLQGKPDFLYLPTICTLILTDNPPILFQYGGVDGRKIYKNGFSLKKNHFTTQISKRFVSYRHFDRGNSS